MNPKLSIGIVGGSLIGPLTELLLRDVGFSDITVYEGMDGAWPQAGGVIGIRETGFDALKSATVPLGEVVAYPGHEVITYDIDVQTRQVLRQRDFSIYPGETTAWDIFHASVASRIKIRFGHRVTGMDENGVLTFANGHTAKHDLVIFADGRNSTGRRILDPSRKTSYQGYLVWRGVTRAIPDVVGFTRFRNDRGYLFSLTEPVIRGVHKGETDWTLYENVSHDQFTTWVGKSPTRKGFLLPWDFNDALVSHLRSHSERHFPAPLAEVVHKTDGYMAVPINDIPMPSRGAWRRGTTRTILLGDALMIVRPHSGRGVNNGIDQAWALMQHLRTHRDLDDALNDWQIEVIPRINEWVELGIGRAQRNGLGVHV